MWLRKSKTSEPDESEKALVESRKAIQEVRARRPEVKALSAASRLLRERNHFSEQLEPVVGGMPKHVR